MTPDEQNKIASALVAHERILSFLFARYLLDLSPEQREDLEQTLGQGPSMPSLPGADIGMVDDVAGVAIEYHKAIKRLFRTSLELADSWRKD